MLGLLLFASSTVALLEQRDAMDDHLNAYAVLGDRERHLIAGCERQGSGQVRVQLQFDRYIGDASPGALMGGTDIAYRFDDRPAETVRWRSRDHVVFAEWEETKPLKFILAMKGSTRVIIRATRQSGDTVELAFAYPDPTAALDTVLDRCGLTSVGLPKPRSQLAAAPPK